MILFLENGATFCCCLFYFFSFTSLYGLVCLFLFFFNQNYGDIINPTSQRSVLVTVIVAQVQEHQQ